mmetsp:Transcript_15693/g.28630  ORF Transcript_15693/g.28630 Transcript_15693/m.28630 type:complete len:185 (+) Transcript_15693:2324-2878(+)
MSILEDFLVAYKYLPSDIVRSLELMRQLDSQLRAEQTTCTNLKSQFFSKHDNSVLKQVRQLHDSMTNLADEKLAIAKYLSDAIVSANHRLSESIKSLESQVRVHHEETPQKKQKEDNGTLIFLQDLPIFEEDKPMCICGEGSYGDMVKCDNPQCSREWFHYKCVGIESQPDGSWFCPTCSSKME